MVKQKRQGYDPTAAHIAAPAEPSTHQKLTKSDHHIACKSATKSAENESKVRQNLGRQRRVGLREMREMRASKVA